MNTRTAGIGLGVVLIGHVGCALGGPTPDLYEPDGDVFTATLLHAPPAEASVPPIFNLYDAQAHGFHQLGDEDWLTVKAQDGTLLIVSFSLSPETPDDPLFQPILEIYDGPTDFQSGVAPIETYDRCGMTGALSFQLSFERSMFWRIRNCPELQAIGPFLPVGYVYTAFRITGFGTTSPALATGNVTRAVDGSPVPGLVLEVDQRFTFTNAQGHYREIVDIGNDVPVSLISPDYLPSTQKIPVVVQDGQYTIDFVVPNRVFSDGFELRD